MLLLMPPAWLLGRDVQRYERKSAQSNDLRSVLKKIPPTSVHRVRLSHGRRIHRVLRPAHRHAREAEWERAARGGGEHSLYSWGDTPPEELPDYARRWKSGPELVGLYPPNAYGLYNLGDNVHEWCIDWYDTGYYSYSPERNPQGPDNN